MRLGRRLATGVAEHPPAREPVEEPAAPRGEEVPAERAAVPAEPVPAELAAER